MVTLVVIMPTTTPPAPVAVVVTPPMNRAIQLVVRVVRIDTAVVELTVRLAAEQAGGVDYNGELRLWWINVLH
jgi:hypothetical protein